MQGKKAKLLILSVSVLILLTIVYVYSGSKTSTKKEGPTPATYVIEASDRVWKFAQNVYLSSKSRIEQKREEKRLREEAQKILLGEYEEAFVVEELDEEPVEVVEYIDEPSTYEPDVSITIPEDMVIERSFGKIEFREVYDYVYACDCSKLYQDPFFEEGAVKTAGRWEQFLRVGISPDCCYQLVTKEGRLVYADGSHFRRYREDMPLTEDISLQNERVLLDVKYVSQFPSLPNGCEVTSLATVLKYMEFDISKERLASEFLPKAPIGEANFYEEFVGDPANRNSYGCYAGAIVNTANAYFESIDSDYMAYDLSGASFENLLRKVRAGDPVIVWATYDINEDPGYTTEWIVDGEYLVWKANLHCMVLCGYDLYNNTVTVSDPMRGIKEYDLETFIKRYKQFYSQAVIIEPSAH